MFQRCSEALAEFKRRLPRMVDVIKAIRIAALELEYRYRDKIHDEFFERFDAGSLTTEDTLCVIRTSLNASLIQMWISTHSANHRVAGGDVHSD